MSFKMNEKQQKKTKREIIKEINLKYGLKIPLRKKSIKEAAKAYFFKYVNDLTYFNLEISNMENLRHLPNIYKITESNNSLYLFYKNIHVATLTIK